MNLLEKMFERVEELISQIDEIEKTSTGQELEDRLAPIQKEAARLKIMFWAVMVAIAVLAGLSIEAAINFFIRLAA
jgi:hypothetical protein